MIINNKIIVIAVILIVVSGLFFSGCASEQQTAPQATEPAEESATADEPAVEEEVEQLFAMEEIAAFDGQAGRPAYIVVDGVVYDVTNVSQWRSGTHFGFSAGTDVTEALAGAAPHGAGLLNQAEIVGRITD